ncbi:hypothetical protein AQJ67_18535 [Streptomyces caeruleatus]|uniref:Uncharacterized protein n=1 Tax=Streptomyces caeruleatus TaxID=661399 RepID=A0A101U2X8_9ACTN|nr:hypothetical protein AQJ67_18535 [Streptomyces caeruleatus]
MLLIGGGKGDALTGLQNLTILAAAPFTLVMVGLCVALTRDLRQDPLIIRGRIGKEAIETAVIAGHEKYDGDFELRIGPVACNDGTEDAQSQSQESSQPTQSPSSAAR